MTGPTIGDATHEERLWAGRLMAASEPWITLGRGEDACRAAALDPAYVTLVARGDGAPLGFARFHPRGVAGSPYLASIAVDSGGARARRGLGAPRRRGRRAFPARAGCSCACRTSTRGPARSTSGAATAFVGELPDYVVDGFAEHPDGQEARLSRAALVALLAATATASYLARVNVSVAGALMMKELALDQIADGARLQRVPPRLRPLPGAGRDARGPLRRAARPRDRGALVGRRDGAHGRRARGRGAAGPPRRAAPPRHRRGAHVPGGGRRPSPATSPPRRAAARTAS